MKENIVSVNAKEENVRQLESMRKNLKKLRESQDWSIEYLSNVAGINEKILTQIEEGQDFEVRYLIRLCGIYNVKPREIFSHTI